MYFWVFILFFWGHTMFCQVIQRSVLEENKRKNKQEIGKINLQLQEIIVKKLTNDSRLNLLVEKQKLKEKRIELLKKQQNYLLQEEREISNEIRTIEQKYSRLQAEYSNIILESSKKTVAFNKLLFILDANRIVDFFRRIQYIRLYNRQQGRNLRKLLDLKIQIGERRKGILTVQQEKAEILGQLEKELGKVRSLKNSKELDNKKLLEQSEELKKQAQILQKENEAIEKLIKNVYSKSKSSSKTTKTLTIGKLSLPIESPKVIENFGIKEIEGIQVQNMGVILKGKSPKVRAVSSGKIIAVSQVKLRNLAVYIQHGEFITVYINLEKVEVKVGGIVNENSVLGKAAKSQLEFQIWQKTVAINPLPWLKLK